MGVRRYTAVSPPENRCLREGFRWLLWGQSPVAGFRLLLANCGLLRTECLHQANHLITWGKLRRVQHRQVRPKYFPTVMLERCIHAHNGVHHWKAAQGVQRPAGWISGCGPRSSSEGHEHPLHQKTTFLFPAVSNDGAELVPQFSGGQCFVEYNRNMSKSKGWTLQSSLLTLWMEKTRVNNQTKIDDDVNLLKTL